MRPILGCWVVELIVRGGNFSVDECWYNDKVAPILIADEHDEESKYRYNLDEQ